MSRYQEFLAAKQAIRAHPDWTDKQVAEAIGVKTEIDTPGMAGIREARKDVAAGDSTQPDTSTPSR